MKDSLERQIKYLRLSVTDRCNYRCAYCMPDDGCEWLAHGEILRYEEMLRILKILAEQGVSRVRITGGEPLVRSGIVDFIKQVRELDGIDDVAMTTNGSLLTKFAAGLKEAGLDRINISLDTVDPERFRALTRGGNVQDVLSGIQEALAVGLTPVKLNVVLTEAVTEKDLHYFYELAETSPVAVRFIEYMPSHGCRVQTGMKVADVTDFLERKVAGKLQAPTNPPRGCGPARYVQSPEGKGVFGFISPISEGYCADCNRIRLTPDGKIRPCLLSEQEIDLKKALRDGSDDAVILALFRKAVESKQKQHGLQEDGTAFQARGMSRIGG